MEKVSESNDIVDPKEEEWTQYDIDLRPRKPRYGDNN